MVYRSDFYTCKPLAGVLLGNSVVYFIFLVANGIFFRKTLEYYTNWTLVGQSINSLALGVLHLKKYEAHTAAPWVRNFIIMFLLPLQLATGVSVAVGITCLVPYTSMIDEGIAQYGKALVYSWNTAFHYVTILIIFAYVTFDWGYVRLTFKHFSNSGIMQFGTGCSSSVLVFLTWASLNDPNVVYETAVDRYIMVLGIIACQVLALACFYLVVYTATARADKK